MFRHLARKTALYSSVPEKNTCVDTHARFFDRSNTVVLTVNAGSVVHSYDAVRKE